MAIGLLQSIYVQARLTSRAGRLAIRLERPPGACDLIR